MNNSYKANESTEQAILDVIERTDGRVAFEFKKLLNDINIGISINEAFLRMYRRVGSSSILYISRVLNLVNKSGISMIDAFSAIEKKLIDDEKFNNEVLIINKTNKFALLVFMFLPFIFISSLILYSNMYVDVFTGYIGSIVLSIILILYLFYLIIIHRIYRGDNNDK
jgi:tight adherence protein B